MLCMGILRNITMSENTCEDILKFIAPFIPDVNMLFGDKMVTSSFENNVWTHHTLQISCDLNTEHPDTVSDFISAQLQIQTNFQYLTTTMSVKAHLLTAVKSLVNTVHIYTVCVPVHICVYKYCL